MNIITDFRRARASLRLGRYEAWQVEWLAHRVQRLLDKCEQLEHAGDDLGQVAGGVGSDASSSSHACSRANAPPV